MLKNSKNHLVVNEWLLNHQGVRKRKVKTSVCRHFAIVIHSGHESVMDRCLNSMSEENVFEIYQVNVYYHQFIFVFLYLDFGNLGQCTFLNL